MDIVWIAVLAMLWLLVAALAAGLDRLGGPRGERP